ncbi:MAG: hypothetical protein ACREXX_09765 [Gammaproteobacteria bacterium]
MVVYADATVSMSTEFIVAQQEAFQEDARAVEQVFRTRLQPTGLAFEWSNADTGDEPTMRAASTCCNTADLVVASQYHDSIPAAAGYSPDELVLGTGRPVLIVPTSGAVRPVGRRERDKGVREIKIKGSEQVRALYWIILGLFFGVPRRV